VTPATPIDAAALAQARESLEFAYRSPETPICSVVRRTDLRLVLDALKEARLGGWNDALIEAENAVFHVARSRKNKRTNEFKLPLQEIKAIRALAVTAEALAAKEQS
jgi:hypothetical protein